MASEEAEGMPFIGDVYDIDKGIFLGTSVLTDSVSVSSLRIQDNVFEIEVALSSKIEKSTSFERDEDSHVVIGVEIELPKTGPVSVTADVLKDREETVWKPTKLKIKSNMLPRIKSTYTGIKTLNLGTRQLILVPYHYYKFVISLTNKGTEKFELWQEKSNVTKKLERFLNEVKRLRYALQKIKFSVPKSYRERIDELECEVERRKISLIEKIGDLFRKRKIKAIQVGLDVILDEIETFEENINESGNDLTATVGKLKKKTRLVKILLNDGIRYVGDEKPDFEDGVQYFVLFIKEQYEPDDIFKNVNEMYKLREEYVNDAKYVVVDLDVHEFNEPPQKSVIYHYKNRLLSADFVNDRKNLKNVGHVSFPPLIVAQKPETTSLLFIKCPDKCDNRPKTWFCYRCGKKIEYGFDYRFYCDCGYGQIADAAFKCDYRHDRFIPFKDVKSLKTIVNALKPLEVITVLLIGQSGVGKSTWINSTLNYLNYDSLSSAEKGEFLYLIPHRFTIYDADEEHEVKIGEDDNEVTSVGKSSTQSCRTYEIIDLRRKIRFIDTPGLGDTDGYEKDTENLTRIVQYLNNFREINAVCFLLKSQVSRLEVDFKYPIKQLFTILHKKSANNIVFCYTHSRTVKYRRSKIDELIEKLLKDSGIEIALNDKNSYYFDNESFRYLCAVKSDYNFDKAYKAAYAESWRKSVKETKRLVTSVSKLIPYSVSNTKLIATIRFKMSCAFRLLNDVKREREIESYKTELEDYHQQIRDLKNKLYENKASLIKTSCSYRNVVCTNVSCTEKFKNETYYKTICCRNCTVSASENIMPNPQLLQCDKLSDETCKNCRCRWEQHVVISYTQEKGEQQVEDLNVKQRMSRLRDKAKATESRLEQLRLQTTTEGDLKKYGALVAGFLKQNALILVNNSISEYLSYLITLEESKLDKNESDKMKIRRLLALKNENEEETKLINQMNDENLSNRVITLMNINLSENKLPILKNLIDASPFNKKLPLENSETF